MIARTAGTSRGEPSSDRTIASTFSPTTAPSAICSAIACSRIEWQTLSPIHGYTRPESVDLAGVSDAFDEAMHRSAELHARLAERFPHQAGYAVSLAYKVRFYLDLNAREAMHLIELRTTPQGHPAYRTVGQEMHRLIAEEAGHRADRGSDEPHRSLTRAEPRATGRRTPSREHATRAPDVPS